MRAREPALKLVAGRCTNGVFAITTLGIVRSLCAFAVLAIPLAACAPEGSVATPQAPSGGPPAAAPLSLLELRAKLGPIAQLQQRAIGRSWLDANTFERLIAIKGRNHILYASSYAGNTVDLYQYDTAEKAYATQKPFGQIAIDRPAGLAVDAAQNLYVVDCAKRSIDVFTPGSMPKIAYSFPAPADPQGIAVGPDGSVYVASNDGAVAAYKRGASQPFETITDPAMRTAYYVVVDRANDMYISYSDIPNNRNVELGTDLYVGEVKANTTRLVSLDLPHDAYNMRLDGQGNLLTYFPYAGDIRGYENGTGSERIAIHISEQASVAFFDLSYARDQIFSYAAGPDGSGISVFAYPGTVGESAAGTIDPGSPGYDFGIVTAPAAPYPPPFTKSIPLTQRPR